MTEAATYKLDLDAWAKKVRSFVSDPTPVRETTTTTGTGALTLAGAVSGFQAAADVYADGDVFAGAITNGADWEFGFYAFKAGTVVRSLIEGSSNNGAAVNWGAGSKIVIANVPNAREALQLMPFAYTAPLVAGVSGGVLGFTGVATLASSVLLTLGAPVVGGGAGATPYPLAPSAVATRYLANTGTLNAAAWDQVNASNGLSGTLQAAQFPALTGDVTTSGGALATTIGANKVTLPMMATIADATVLGNSSGITANVSALATLPTGVQDNITRLGTVTALNTTGRITQTYNSSLMMNMDTTNANGGYGIWSRNSGATVNAYWGAAIQLLGSLSANDFGIDTNAGNFHLLTAGATRLSVLNSNGNVGIGTTSPGVPLHVMGSSPLRLERSGVGIYNFSIAGGAVSSDTADLTLNSPGNGGFLFQTNSGNTNALAINNAGNVGIGTTTPNASFKLDVNGAAYADSLSVNYGKGANGNAIINGGTNLYLRPASGALINDTGATYLTGGNVGIGAGGGGSAPSAQLHINDAAHTGTIRLGSVTYYDTIQANASTGLTTFDKNYVAVGSDPAYQFKQNGGALATILGSGNVGIGANSPGEALDVQLGTSPAVRTQGSANPYFYAKSTTNNVITKLQSIGGSSVGYLGTESNHSLSLITNNAPRLTIDTSGNVGIGTLTSGRIPQITTNGRLTDSASLTVSSDVITALGFTGPHNGTLGATTPSSVVATTGSFTGVINHSNGVLVTEGFRLGADTNASTRTNATQKVGQIALAHYTNAEEYIGGLQYVSSLSANGIYIGGGTGLGLNAATEVSIWAAANTTTVDGTKVASFMSAASSITNATNFPGVGTTASPANAYLDNSSSPANNLLRSTSSLRYKNVIDGGLSAAIVIPTVMRLADAAMKYTSRAAADDPYREFYGMGAEIVDQIDPRLVTRGRFGVAESVQYERLPVLHSVMLANHESRLVAAGI